MIVDPATSVELLLLSVTIIVVDRVDMGVVDRLVVGFVVGFIELGEAVVITGVFMVVVCFEIDSVELFSVLEVVF